MRHVVIIGGGFGGLTAAQELRKAPVRITLIDRVNYHLFQPLLYQVAMSGLSPADIAVPIRSVLHKDREARVILDEVTGIDLEHRVVHRKAGSPIPYDYVILAAGARTNYFGHDEWSKDALGLKDIDEAVEIRRRVLLAFEAAEREPDPAKRGELLSFVVIGGGPTGVELAGSLAELSRFVLKRDFRVVKPEDAKVILLEAGPRILPAFDPKLSESAVSQLHELGVEVRTGAAVTGVDPNGVRLGNEFFPASTVLWGAGVVARPLAKSLGVPLDRGGRVIVESDCSIPGHPEAFAIGDIASFAGPDGRPLPGLAPVALQQARRVARNIERDLEGRPRQPFRYVDKGIMATIGRSRAVAQTGKLRFSGFVAWLAWLFVHLWFIVGFRNRFLVFYNWTYNYLTYKRGARLITGRRLQLLPQAPERWVEEEPQSGLPPPRREAPEPAARP